MSSDLPLDPGPRHESSRHEADRRRSYDEVRRRNERWITGFIAAACLLFSAVSLGRLRFDEAGFGMVGLLCAGSVLAYYAVAFWQAGKAAPSPLQAGFRTLVEVSVASVVTLGEATGDPVEALLNAPVLLYAMAIFLSVLRLRPRLSLLAGTLAAVEWMGVHLTHMSPEVAAYSALNLVGMAGRMVSLVLCGVLAWRVGRSLEGLTVRVADSVLEHEQVRRAFGAYVAEPVVERVLSGDLQLSTERRVISVLFVDIRGFTTFSADREPTEVLARLNQALEAFSIEVRDRGGIVNKFLGDGLMALFGAPVEDPHHARLAAEAAVAIAAAAQALADSGAYPGLRIGVGLHCGEVVVGDIGGQGHREYTAIGDVVNVASRVEGVTKELGETVLVTRAVVEAMGEGFSLGEVQRVQLRGRAEPVELFPLR